MKVDWLAACIALRVVGAVFRRWRKICTIGQLMGCNGRYLKKSTKCCWPIRSKETSVKYTPLTLLSQRKLALTARNTLFALLSHWSTQCCGTETFISDPVSDPDPASSEFRIRIRFRVPDSNPGFESGSRSWIWIRIRNRQKLVFLLELGRHYEIRPHSRPQIFLGRKYSYRAFCSVADPDPGSGIRCLLIPGSGMG